MKYEDKKLLLMVGAGLLVALYLKGKAEDGFNGAIDAINPTNNDNIFYSGANSVFRAITGNETDTIGTWVYGVFN